MMFFCHCSGLFFLCAQKVKTVKQDSSIEESESKLISFLSLSQANQLPNSRMWLLVGRWQQRLSPKPYWVRYSGVIMASLMIKYNQQRKRNLKLSRNLQQWTGNWYTFSLIKWSYGCLMERRASTQIQESCRGNQWATIYLPFLLPGYALQTEFKPLAHEHWEMSLLLGEHTTYDNLLCLK